MLIRRKKLNEVYGKKYKIRLDHDILKDHGAFYPRALANELVFEIPLALAAASGVVSGSDPTKLSYEVTNIHLEYEVIQRKDFADLADVNYLNGKRFMFEHVTHHKTITIAKGKDSIINEGINVPRRSMKGILLLFYEPYTEGIRGSKKTFNPDIKDEKAVVNGVKKKVFSQGMKTRDMFDEVFRRFVKEHSSMSVIDFYAGGKFALFVDLRSIKDNELHGSGMILMDTKDGVLLAINRTASGSGNVKDVRANCLCASLVRR